MGPFQFGLTDTLCEIFGLSVSLIVGSQWPVLMPWPKQM